MIRRLLALGFALSAVTGCTSPVDSDSGGEMTSGTWQLIRLDGRTLPIDEGTVTTRWGEPTSCLRILAAGAAAFDASRSRYTLHYHHRNSCTEGILSRTTWSGDFQVVDGGLRLGSDFSDFEFDGRIEGDRFEMHLFETFLEFAEPRPPIDTIRGQFRLTSPDPLFDPCHGPVESATLSLEPLPGLGTQTGRFELATVSAVPCVATIHDTGTYEQVDRILDFTARLSSNTVARYRGEIEDDRIVLYLGENWIFDR